MPVKMIVPHVQVKPSLSYNTYQPVLQLFARVESSSSTLPGISRIDPYYFTLKVGFILWHECIPEQIDQILCTFAS